MQKNILNPSTYSKEHLNLRTQLRFQPIIELNLCLPSWRRYGRPKKVFRKPKNHWLLFSCCVFSWLSSRLVWWVSGSVCLCNCVSSLQSSLVHTLSCDTHPHVQVSLTPRLPSPLQEKLSWIYSPSKPKFSFMLGSRWVLYHLFSTSIIPCVMCLV